MTATADYSDGKVPKNETAFPLCRDITIIIIIIIIIIISLGTPFPREPKN